MPRTLLFIFSATLLAGCATAPLAPLSADSPASPEAAASAPAGHPSSLRPDEATLRSRALLSTAAHAQKQWNDEGPVSGTPAEPGAPAKPDAMPGMDHSKMKGMTP